MRVDEVVTLYSSNNQYKEIEFVCHNSNFKDSTNVASQQSLFRDLKALQVETNHAIFPYMQDFSDENGSQTSLAVIILDKRNTAKLEAKIKELASNNHVEIDLYNYLDNNQVDARVKEFS